MKRAEAIKFKRGNRVKFKAFFMIGIVRRAAKDGSWIDVDWGTWTKRQKLPATGLFVLSGAGR